jgi:outer membrane protein assembly factor BamA
MGADAYTPPEDRFFLGGPNTVRGFAQNRLGPVVYVLDTVTTAGDLPDSVIRVSASGGKLLALGNLELRFPVAGDGRFTAVAFVDVGFVGDRLADFQDRVRVTPGTGIRVETPVGPVRVDIGFNPHASEKGPLFIREDETLAEITDSYIPAKTLLDHFRLHFSLGQAY